MIGAIAGDIIGSVYETRPIKTKMQTVTPLPASPAALPKHIAPRRPRSSPRSRGYYKPTCTRLPNDSAANKDAGRRENPPHCLSRVMKGEALPAKVRVSWCMARVQATYSRLRSISVE